MWHAAPVPAGESTECAVAAEDSPSRLGTSAQMVARGWAWVVLPLGGMVWVATRYSRVWYVWDEWEAIARATGADGWLRTSFEGHNGHLYLGTYLLYHLQGEWFGFESHRLVYLAFLLSLAALQLSIAAVLTRLGVPAILSLLAATVVTFFGAGAEIMVYEWNLSANFALAACFAAAFVALGTNSRPRLQVASVAGLLVLSVALDSGLAVFGAIFVGVVVVMTWPWRRAIAALALPLLANAAWYFLDESATSAPAPLRPTLEFAFHLVTRAAGGLVGGWEKAGVVALVAATVCVIVGLVRRRIPLPAIASLVGGLLAAGVMVASAAATRTGYVKVTGLPGSRFVQQVAVLLLLAYAPAIAATVRPVSVSAKRAAGVVVVAGLVLVFVLNLSQVTPVQQFHEAWSSNVKAGVRETVAIVSEGCADGRTLDPQSRPIEIQSPQITVGLVQGLLSRGSLGSSFASAPSLGVLEAVCVDSG